MSVSQFYRFILIVFVSDDKKPLATAYPEPKNDPPPAVEGDGEAEESPAAPIRPAVTTSIPIGLYLS